MKYYLVLYNILSTLGWAYILLIAANAVFNLDGTHATVPPSPKAGTVQGQVEAALPAVLVPAIRRAARAYAEVGAQTAFVQSFAALEVLHVLLGWVRSPLGTTLIQVGSRLYLVWGITHLFPQVRIRSKHAISPLPFPCMPHMRAEMHFSFTPSATLCSPATVPC